MLNLYANALDFLEKHLQLNIKVQNMLLNTFLSHTIDDTAHDSDECKWKNNPFLLEKSFLQIT